MSIYEDDEDDDGYFAEVDPDIELTGLMPKFVKIDGSSTPPNDLAAMRIDELVPLYLKCRNQLATDTKGYNARKARIKGFMQMISMVLRDKADVIGTDSFKGPYGTAYRNKKEKFTIDNWEAFTKYIESTHNFHALQKRVSPNAIKEIRTTDGLLPPGVVCFTEVEFSVRSPTGARKQ